MENMKITSKGKLSTKDIQSRFMDFISNSKRLVVIVAIGFTAFVTLFVASRIDEINDTQTRAALTQAHLFISPESQTMPPNSVFSVMLDAGESELGFVRIGIEYDRDKIGLYRDIEPSQAFRLIEVTPIDEANATGKITIVMGVDPQGTGPQVGIIELAKLWFTTTTPLSNQTAYINFINPELQVVGLDPIASAITTSGSTLTLNPTPQPSPTSTPVSTPSPISQTCDSICQENGFSGGACVRNRGQCKKADGSYLGAGSTYCSGANSTCCCN